MQLLFWITSYACNADLIAHQNWFSISQKLRQNAYFRGIGKRFTVKLKLV